MSRRRQLRRLYHARNALVWEIWRRESPEAVRELDRLDQVLDALEESMYALPRARRRLLRLIWGQAYIRLIRPLVEHCLQNDEQVHAEPDASGPREPRGEALQGAARGVAASGTEHPQGEVKLPDRH